MMMCARWHSIGGLAVIAVGCVLMFESMNRPAGRDSLERLTSAACNGDVAEARMIWARMDESDARTRHEAAVKMLHTGATVGHAAIVRQALEWGAEPDARSLSCCTALMMAAGSPESLAIARLLLDAGADPDALDSHGFTPLSNAIILGDTTMAKLLIERGASACEPARVSRARHLSARE